VERKAANPYSTLARAFGYPAPGLLAAMMDGWVRLQDGRVKAAYRACIDRLQSLSMGEWEELYTRTLDLNPPAAPYVGYQMWGESYQRGSFLARMSRELREAGVDSDGELPDHVAPVLIYLASTPEPLPELVEVLDPALERMHKGLQSVDPGNPYLSLLEAVRAQCEALKKEDA
jgi:nitrate reductase molybdenum cofactor assembly chaperone NarJ/NarW